MSHATAEPRVPVSVITGFLGSGKTTLLNALLKHPGMAETAVLVNEFGEIGIDHLLFEALDDDVVLLAAGCLCCTIREDMITSLRSLFERRAGGEVPKFRRVVIETTGLADPAPILHTLLAKDRRNNRPICVDRGELVWSLSGSLSVRARTFRDRSDAIWSRLRSEHGNTGVGRGAWRGGAVAHPWAQSGHVQ